MGAGAASLGSAASSNDVPDDIDDIDDIDEIDDIDGEGQCRLVGGELVLEDVWLGSSQRPVEPAACGHRFAP